MKYFFRILSSIVLVLCVSIFSACGSALSGEYINDAFGATMDFHDGNEVTFTCIIGNFDGTYEIKDDKITFDWGDQPVYDFMGTHSFKKGSDYVKIGFYTFTK